MKIFTFLAALLFASVSYAQDIKGYYITASGQRTEGYFKQADFNDTASLRFSTSKKGEYAPLSDNVVEYGTDEDRLKFEKHNVNIDISGSDSTSKTPEFLTQTVFLNVILKGDALLYSYTKDYRTKYFLGTQDKPGINELVNKKYRLENGSTAENPMYRQQLFNALKCKRQTVSDFSGMLYGKKELAQVVQDNNDCMGSGSESFGPKRKSNFKYTVVGGAYNTMLKIPNGKPDVGSTGSDTNYGIGIEASYVFSSETTELFFRGEFETMNVTLDETKDLNYNYTRSIYKIKGTAVNIYVGPRYNVFINDNNKIFFDASFCISIPSGDITKETIITPPAGGEYNGQGFKYGLKPGFAVNLGVGYTLNDKFGLALRYETNRDFLDGASSAFKMNLSRLGLNLRYTLN